MKKNLIAIIILALQIVNIALTVVMMIMVVNINGSAVPIIKSVATVLQIETGEGDADTEEVVISLADTEVWELSDSMTIPLKVEDGGKQVYMVCDISLQINTKHEDYATYSESLSNYESLIKDAIRTVVASHTEAECTNDQEGLKLEILKAVQELFGSDFIYSIAISEVKFG